MAKSLLHQQFLFKKGDFTRGVENTLPVVVLIIFTLVKINCHRLYL